MSTSPVSAMASVSALCLCTASFPPVKTFLPWVSTTPLSKGFYAMFFVVLLQMLLCAEFTHKQVLDWPTTAKAVQRRRRRLEKKNSRRQEKALERLLKMKLEKAHGKVSWLKSHRSHNHVTLIAHTSMSHYEMIQHKTWKIWNLCVDLLISQLNRGDYLHKNLPI